MMKMTRGLLREMILDVLQEDCGMPHEKQIEFIDEPVPTMSMGHQDMSPAIDNDEGEIYGHGGTARMARSQLYQISTDAAELHDILGDNDELPEWVQAKIAVIEDNLDAVMDHLSYKALRHDRGNP